MSGFSHKALPEAAIERLKRRQQRLKEPFQKKSRSWVKYLLIAFVLCILIGGSIVGYVVSRAYAQLPDISDPSVFQLQQGSAIYDKDESEILYRLSGDVQRRIVPLDQINQNMILALLAAEDDEFYGHPGFDTGGIIMAMCYEASSQAGLGTLGGICPQRGGSTLTQQMVKNILLTNERTFDRKLKEILLASQIERSYTKEDILETYLNFVSLGGNFSGVEQAANAYFESSASELSPAQSAILAAIVQRPTHFSPYGPRARSHITVPIEQLEEAGIDSYESLSQEQYNEWWNFGLIGQDIELTDGTIIEIPGRADWVLGRMHLGGCSADSGDTVKLPCLTEEAHEEAKEELKNMEFAEYTTRITAPHFVMYVREQAQERILESYPDMLPEEVEQLLGSAGLKIVTTLDLNHQRAAEKAVQDQLSENLNSYNANNAALVSIKPETGFITAMVGSANYWDDEIDGKVNVTESQRLPGSSFKPLAMAASIANGDLSSESVLFDVETEFSGGYKPRNFDGEFDGPITIRESLARSRNIPSVKATLITGVDKVHQFVTSLGINLTEGPEFYGSSLSLGSGGASPLEMAGAYAVFSNGGYGVEPTAILRIEDLNGNILYQANSKRDEEEKPIIDPRVSYIMTDMLSDTEARPADWNRYLASDEHVFASKTGTADKKVEETARPVDAWTVGYSPFLVTAVWAGNTRGEVMAPRAAGLTNAGPIWKQFMEETHQDAPREGFSRPEGIVEVEISRLSGKLPTASTPAGLIREGLFIEEHVPTEEDSSFARAEIDTISGLLATDLTPESTRESRLFLSPKAHFSENPAWQDPVNTWARNSGNQWLAALGVGGEGAVLGGVIPTEYDNVHTEEVAQNSPVVEILSPRPTAQIEERTVALRFRSVIPHEFSSAQILWDGTEVVTTSNPSNEYIIAVPPEASGAHTISVILRDALGYETTDSVEVRVSSDRSIETPRFILSQTSAEPGESLVLQVAGLDETYQSVEFFLDGESIGIRESVPHSIEYRVPNEASGNLNLSAVVTEADNDQLTLQRALTISDPESEANEEEALAPEEDEGGEENDTETQEPEGESVEPETAEKEPSTTENNETNVSSAPTSFSLLSPNPQSSASCPLALSVAASIPTDLQSTGRVSFFAESAETGEVTEVLVSPPLEPETYSSLLLESCGEWSVWAQIEHESGRRVTGRSSVSLSE